MQRIDVVSVESYKWKNQKIIVSTYPDREKSKTQKIAMPGCIDQSLESLFDLAGAPQKEIYIANVFLLIKFGVSVGAG